MLNKFKAIESQKKTSQTLIWWVAIDAISLFDLFAYWRGMVLHRLACALTKKNRLLSVYELSEFWKPLAQLAKSSFM